MGTESHWCALSHRFATSEANPILLSSNKSPSFLLPVKGETWSLWSVQSESVQGLGTALLGREAICLMHLSSYLRAVFSNSHICRWGFLMPEASTMTVVSFYLVGWNNWLELNSGHKSSFPRFCAVGYLTLWNNGCPCHVTFLGLFDWVEKINMDKRWIKKSLSSLACPDALAVIWSFLVTCLFSSDVGLVLSKACTVLAGS